jgi:hypothetical protein
LTARSSQRLLQLVGQGGGTSTCFVPFTVQFTIPSPARTCQCRHNRGLVGLTRGNAEDGGGLQEGGAHGMSANCWCARLHVRSDFRLPDLPSATQLRPSSLMWVRGAGYKRRCNNDRGFAGAAGKKGFGSWSLLPFGRALATMRNLVWPEVMHASTRSER